MRYGHHVIGGLLLFLLMAQSLPAAEPPQLIIQAPESLRSLATRLRNVKTQKFLSTMQLTGLEHPGPPIHVILASEQSTLADQAPSWASGYAISHQGVIVLLPERVPSYPYTSLDMVLSHEIAHVLVARAARGRPVPRWFDEGLAMVAARTWDIEDRARLVWAMVAASHVSFAQVNALFQQDQASARRAYVLANAVVRDLLQRYGPEMPKHVLALIAHDVPFEDALFRVTSSTVAEVEASFWTRHQYMWTRWIPVVTSSIVLWTGIVLLAVYAFKKQRKRAAVLKREWEEEDRKP